MLERYDFGANPTIIGQSLWATVYKVTDTQLQRPVALKVFAREDAIAHDVLESIARIGSVSGANLVSIIDHGLVSLPNDTRLLPFLALEFCEGRALARDPLARVNWSEVSPEDAGSLCADALEVIQHAFAGLQQLHQAKYQHLDIKPSNILVLRNSERRVTGAKLIDAGLGSIARDGEHTAVLYQSPEQLSGAQTSAASDVFALGVVAYELLTRTHPFALASSRVDAEAVAHNIATVTPVTLSELNRYIPENLAIIIHKTLSSDPVDRPSAEEVVRLLDSASAYTKQWLAISPEVAKAVELYEGGKLEEAATLLTALERKGWAFPQINELRTRINAELEFRKNVLERQADDVVAIEEALASGRARQAWYSLELLRTRQECDPYEQPAHHADFARLSKDLKKATESERKWLSRVNELLRSMRVDDAITECAQIGSAVRPSKAVLALELECRANKYRGVINEALLLLDAPSQDQRATLAASAMEEIYATPNAVSECFQLLEARSGLIDELRFELATHHDAREKLGELEVVETLLKIAPDRKLAEEQRSLEADVQRQMADEQSAIWQDTLERLAEIGDWQRARALMRSAPRPVAEPRPAPQPVSAAPVVAAPPAPKLQDVAPMQSKEPEPQPARSSASTSASAPKAVPKRTAAKPATSGRTIAAGAAGLTMLLLAAVAIPRSKVAVTFGNVPSGSRILVDRKEVRKERVMLSPGSHRYMVSAPGFRPLSSDFEVGKVAMTVPLDLEPMEAAAPRDKPDTTTAELPKYGSVVVLTPGMNDVTVFVDKEEVGHLVSQKFVIDSLSPGTHTITVEKEGGYCLSETRARRVNVQADDERTETFTLKPWPRLVVNSDVQNADVMVSGDETGPNKPGREITLEPGKHTYTVKAAAHRDSTGDVLLKCGESRTLSVPLRPVVVARDTPARLPAPAPRRVSTEWTRECFRSQDGWQKAARDCFYDDGDQVKRFAFEVRRVKKGGLGPVGGGGVYGPWLVGSLSSFYECKIEDGEFRWRAGGKGDWERVKIDFAKDAPSLHVRVVSDPDGAAVEIGTDPLFSQAKRVRVGGKGGFGVKKDTQIREFTRS